MLCSWEWASRSAPELQRVKVTLEEPLNSRRDLLGAEGPDQAGET
jgi:hypothetical protein